MTRNFALACGLIAATQAAPFAAAGQGSNPVVVLDTSMGPITVELYPDKAPITVKNFLEYVKAGHYDSTIFHRVIGPNPRQPQGFMIQGGGFSDDVPPKEKETRPMIKNEGKNGLLNKRGTLAMARQNRPDTASSQFFINLGDNDFLNYGDPNAVSPDGYAVFGAVIEGMDVVDAIAKVDTTRKPLDMLDPLDGKLRRQIVDDVPTDAVVIKTARVKEPG